MNKSKTLNKVWMVTTLKGIQEGDFPSYYHLRTLEKAGYVSIDHVKEDKGRGRPSNKYEVTGKARGYLGFAQKWNATKHLFNV